MRSSAQPVELRLRPCRQDGMQGSSSDPMSDSATSSAKEEPKVIASSAAESFSRPNTRFLLHHRSQTAAAARRVSTQASDAPRPAITAPKTPWAAVVKSAPKTPPPRQAAAGIDTQAASPAAPAKTFADLIKGSTKPEERADGPVQLPPRKVESGPPDASGAAAAKSSSTQPPPEDAAADASGKAGEVGVGVHGSHCRHARATGGGS